MRNRKTERAVKQKDWAEVVREGGRADREKH